MREENKKYAFSTDEFSCSLIQVYTNNIILIAKSSGGLRKFIKDKKNFINIYLNLKKYKLLKHNCLSSMKISINREENNALYF